MVGWWVDFFEYIIQSYGSFFFPFFKCACLYVCVRKRAKEVSLPLLLPLPVSAVAPSPGPGNHCWWFLVESYRDFLCIQATMDYGPCLPTPSHKRKRAVCAPSCTLLINFSWRSFRIPGSFLVFFKLHTVSHCMNGP